jgi:hypothetical protein
MRVLLPVMFLCLQFLFSSTNDVKEFYRAFSSDSLADVNKCIEKLEYARPIAPFIAYKGAMLMKKAVLENTPRGKLNTFKLGHRLLEGEISKDHDNIEFRFLRLVIQERAPEVLKYNKNLQEDKNCIIKGYKTLEPFIQEFIAQYCKKSRVLIIEDLQ